jgi:hypothetical protein
LSCKNPPVTRGPDFVPVLSLFPVVFCFNLVVIVRQLLSIFISNMVYIKVIVLLRICDLSSIKQRLMYT